MTCVKILKYEASGELGSATEDFYKSLWDAVYPCDSVGFRTARTLPILIQAKAFPKDDTEFLNCIRWCNGFEEEIKNPEVIRILGPRTIKSIREIFQMKHLLVAIFGELQTDTFARCVYSDFQVKFRGKGALKVPTPEVEFEIELEPGELG
jgi:hypothetical protein